MRKAVKRLLDNLLGKPFTRLEALENAFSRHEETSKEMSKHFEEMSFSHRLLAAEHARKSLNCPHFQPPKLIENRLSLSCAYAELERLAPRAFAEWRKLFEVNDTEYQAELPDSLSVDGNMYAPRFKEFIAPYLHGYVLDIGCGPQDIPSYLQGYPLDNIYAIDPLPPHHEHPFHFEQALAEFLPWEDNSFQTVVSCTSLDHVLLLDKTFNEIRRALKNEGVFCFLQSFTPGQPPYDPYGEDIKPIDRFHLFHFDKPWLEAMLDEYGFETVERHQFVSGHYYALKLKKG